MIQKDFEEIINMFLDRELPKEEEAELKRYIEINREAKAYFVKSLKLKEALSTMKFKEPEDDVMDEYWNSVSSRLSKGFGWIFVIIGFIANIIYALYAFAISKYINAFEKIVTFMLISGLLLLFISVALQRYRDWKTDKYRGIIK